MTARSAIGDLTGREFDLLVIGGGIHGAFAALEAARRGFHVALIERADYGSATSANSMRVLHGGFRYLRSGDVGRLRESARERDYLRSTAPHLTSPLPCVAPTGTAATPGALAFRAALLAYGTLAPVRKSDPPPRLLDRQEYRRMAGPFAIEAAGGGAMWVDGFLDGAERVLMNVVRTAQAHGVIAANYAECAALIVRGERVCGARVRDGTTDNELEVRARCILDATGPWTSEVTGSRADAPAFARGVNVVVRTQAPSCAVAVPASGGRLLFALPFGDATLLGTWYTTARTKTAPLDGDVMALLGAFRKAVPALEIQESDVLRVHAGLLPLESPAPPDDPAAALRDRPLVVAHGSDAGRSGLISLTGVKWTTARSAALRALGVVERQLGRTRAPAVPDEPLHGGDVGRGAGASWLARQYGSASGEVTRIARESPELAQPLADGHEAIGAAVVHAIREEQALHLADILQRRMGVGLVQPPPDAVVDAAATIAARELAWSDEQRDAEVRAFFRSYGPPA